MELADLVHNLRANQLKLKHSNAVVDQFNRNKTIDILMYMITIVEEDTIAFDSAGEVDSTRMAEIVCKDMDLYINGHDVPEDLFEIASAIATEYEDAHA